MKCFAYGSVLRLCLSCGLLLFCIKLEWTTNTRLTCKSSHGGAVSLRVSISTRHNDQQFGDTYMACIGTCDMICAFKKKFRKDSYFTRSEYALPRFSTNTLSSCLSTSKASRDLPMHPTVSACYTFALVMPSINITIKLISSNHFQKNSLTFNLDRVPYFCNSIVAHLHHKVYHTVL